MHELAIAENIVRSLRELKEEHKVSIIETVTIKTGVLQQVSHESLRFLLEAITRGTDLEGVQFKLENIDATFECNECGKKSTLQGYPIRCPDCGKPDVTIKAGNQLFIESIEVSDENE